MFKNIIVASVLSASIVATAQAEQKVYKFVDGSTFTVHAVGKKEAQQVLKYAKITASDSLLDSESARWKLDDFVYRIDGLKKNGTKDTTYCGLLVNAKNAYGAYVGWRQLDVVGTAPEIVAKAAGKMSFCDMYMTYGKEIKQENKE